MRDAKLGPVLLICAMVASCGDDSDSLTLACDAEPSVMTTSVGVDFVSTPESCFDAIEDFPYEPNYVEIEGLRQAYYDAGPADADPVLLLHGQPNGEAQPGCGLHATFEAK